MKKKQAGKAKRLSIDRISALPQPILEIILSLLPTTKAAVRTSILSREWRYKWTKIPKLEFDHCDRQQHMATTRENMDMRCKNLYNIYKILIVRHSPIHELSLYTCRYCDSFNFDRIIFHLETSTFKKLALNGVSYKSRFDLPISIFLLHQLTDLYLSYIDLEHRPGFDGFGSLRRLVLANVGISTKTLLHLLSNCPSLKSFNLRIGETHFGEPCTIIELFKCLPMIEHLTIYRNAFQIDVNDDSDGEYSVVVREEYSNVWLEHLIELEIVCFGNLKPEMEFVKFILARSPKLKTVRIVSAVLDQDQELGMLKTLLQAPRASPRERESVNGATMVNGGGKSWLTGPEMMAETTNPSRVLPPTVAALLLSSPSYDDLVKLIGGRRISGYGMNPSRSGDYSERERESVNGATMVNGGGKSWLTGPEMMAETTNPSRVLPPTVAALLLSSPSYDDLVKLIGGRRISGYGMNPSRSGDYSDLSVDDVLGAVDDLLDLCSF
ncbi:hypothetical protein SSX86_025511 [Deinandra increscens subsp. villosa]|uniref:F-box/LRR-repeat protein 15/At3g58940/PEG3-like LRR domain-containing protein n=1 Tax=Deinandra increscens subsp. villosa TaxID=3103831 RepID=A0AAP0GLG5_9ASTR